MAREPELGVSPGLTASSAVASDWRVQPSPAGGGMQGHSDSPHIIQVHSIRHNKKAKCPPPSRRRAHEVGMWTKTAGTKWRRRAGPASVPPLLHSNPA